jgi:hypothetical protein
MCHTAAPRHPKVELVAGSLERAALTQGQEGIAAAG